MVYKARNNAYSTLAGSITDVATTLSVAAGHGDRFPVIAGADHTYCTLENAAGTREIIKITARAAAADAMTIVRAQEGTTAVAWNAGDTLELRFTAGVSDDIYTQLAATVRKTGAESIGGDKTFNDPMAITKSLSMLGVSSGSFAAGVWSRDSNWGTYYRGHPGTLADIAFASNNSASVLKIAADSVHVSTPVPLGYGAGAGGTVTQATSKSTAVTLNKPCGQIVTHNAALGAGAVVGFAVNNSLVAATDVITVNHIGGGAPVDYGIKIQPGTGAFTVYLKNESAGSLSDALTLNFYVHKGVSA